MTWIDCVPIPLLKKSTSTNPTRVWAAAEMSWSTIGGVADGDAMATHWGRLFHGTGLWSWGPPECFPKSVMISWYFMWLPPKVSSIAKYHLGNLVDFLFFFSVPKVEKLATRRHGMPRPLSLERHLFTIGSPRSLPVSEMRRQKDAWEMNVGRTFSQPLPEVGGDLKHSQALNYLETLFCSTILQDQFFL